MVRRGRRRDPAPAHADDDAHAIAFDSVTKIATAALAMRLVEQGRLRLDDPISRWYARWRGDPRATIRDLLGHTSGLGDPSDAWFRSLVRHPHRPATLSGVLAATPRPGPRTADAEYSNAGFILAGAILARAAGEPLATAMRRDVLGPGGAGLVLQPAERPRPPLAHPYVYPESGATPVDAKAAGPYLPSFAWADGAGAAGALAGDVPSLAWWGHALLGGHLLKPASLRAMTRFHPARSGTPTASGSRRATSTTGRCGATPGTASAPTPSSGTCRARTSRSRSPGTTTRSTATRRSCPTCSTPCSTAADHAGSRRSRSSTTSSASVL